MTQSRFPASIVAPLVLAAAFVAPEALAANPTPEALARAVIERYAGYSLGEKQAAIAGLASRPATAHLLLDAVAVGTIGRSDVSGFVARQIADLGDEPLRAKLEKVWGRVSHGAADDLSKLAIEEHAKWKSILTPEFLKTADASQGRVVYKTICATCHVLFGEGQKIGPDITGSNRADLDYILENVTNPNAVIGKDYELQMFTLKDGRVVSGIVRKETDSAFTVQTLTAEEVVAKSEVREHSLPGISMMPMGQFTALAKEQVRDLVAYLASPSIVPLPGEAPAGKTMRVPGAIEGESMTVMAKSGAAQRQDMQAFPDSRWSGDGQLWWTGAKPGSQLTLELSVAQAGRYQIQAVLTRAPDYGVVRFRVDGELLSDKQFDFFGWNVTTTPLLTLGERELTAGPHRFTIEITGANPEAVKSYMVGLDYLWLKRL
jgi:putative heme-binding domain-containing protein